MESLIGLVNRIQRACTALGDHGGGDNAFSSLWDALPSVAVVGGQVADPLLFLISLDGLYFKLGFILWSWVISRSMLVMVEMRLLYMGLCWVLILSC